MSKKVVIEIVAAQAAFEGPPKVEIARILRELALGLDIGTIGLQFEHQFKDKDGLVIGTIKTVSI